MMFFTSDEIRRIENHLSAIRENPITEKQCGRCMAFRNGVFPKFKNCIDYNICYYFDGI
jgi:hypothetical protein